MNHRLAIASFMCVVMVALGQWAPFAGTRPTTYTNTPNTKTNNAENTVIADRFGGNTNNVVAGTTERLPHLALGDRYIVDRLNAFPVDQRPFWLINAAAIEAQKNQDKPSTPTNQNVCETVSEVNRTHSVEAGQLIRLLCIHLSGLLHATCES